MASLIAERWRGTQDPVEASGQALKMILDQIAALPLFSPDAGMHGDAAASVMKMAFERASA